jgi:hypothetical protein
MATTLVELMEKLKRLDEVTLMEVLEIDAEMIIDRFGDLVEDRYEELVDEFQEETD